MLFSIISVYFSIRKKIWCWITGNIAVSAYFILFFKTQLYMDMALQVVYFIQGIYGIVYWRNSTDSKQIKVLNFQILLFSLFVILALAGIGGYILSTFTNASLPYIDSVATLLSLWANLLLARKFLQNWIFWIVADIIYVFLFFYKGLYFSSAIYILFLVLSILGYYKWKLNLNTKGDLF